MRRPATVSRRTAPLAATLAAALAATLVAAPTVGLADRAPKAEKGDGYTASKRPAMPPGGAVTADCSYRDQAWVDYNDDGEDDSVEERRVDFSVALVLATGVGDTVISASAHFSVDTIRGGSPSNGISLTSEYALQNLDRAAPSVLLARDDSPAIARVAVLDRVQLVLRSFEARKLITGKRLLLRKELPLTANKDFSQGFATATLRGKTADRALVTVRRTRTDDAELRAEVIDLEIDRDTGLPVMVALNTPLLAEHPDGRSQGATTTTSRCVLSYPSLPTP